MPYYPPGAGAHKTSHENAGSDEIDATGLTGAGGGGGGGWETESTDATKLEAGRTRIWDAALEGSIVLDSSVHLLAGAGFGVEVELGGAGQVLDVNTGDGIILPILAADPTAFSDGHMYYNSATDKIRVRANGAWVDVGVAAAGGTASAVKAYRATTQTISASTMTAIDMTAEELDTDAYHDNSTNPSRVTVPSGKDGVFHALGYGYANLGGTNIFQIRKNGTTALRSQTIETNAGHPVDAGPIALVATDYIELMIWNSAGGAIGDATNVEQQPWIALIRIGS